jgi:hypothetical protein
VAVAAAAAAAIIIIIIIRHEVVGWIHLPQDMSRMWALVNKVMNLSNRSGHFLTIRAAISFSNVRHPQLRSVSCVKEFLNALGLITRFCIYSTPNDDNGHPYIYCVLSCLLGIPLTLMKYRPEYFVLRNR